MMFTKSNLCTPVFICIHIGTQYSMSRLLLFILICYCYSQLVASQDPSKNTVVVQILIIMVLYSAIIQPPQNQSVCEGGAVNFTCVVMFTNATPGAATWFTNNHGGDARGLPGHDSINDHRELPPPAVVTNVLIVTDARLSDNGRDYICTQGIIEESDPVFLTVFSKLLNFYMYVHMYMYVCTCTMYSYLHTHYLLMYIRGGTSFITSFLHT